MEFVDVNLSDNDLLQIALESRTDWDLCDEDLDLVCSFFMFCY